MGFNLLEVNRTRFRISGEFPEKTARELFDKIRGQRLAEMGYHYDTETDETILDFYPCIIQTVEAEVRYSKDKVALQQERRIVMLGAIPTFIDFFKDYWERIKDNANAIAKENAKKKKSEDKDDRGEVRWVTMYYPKHVATPFNEIATEFGFIVDGRCNRDKIGIALDEAAKAVRDKLQLICRDVNPAIMTSARLLDEITMAMTDAIHKLEDDATSERYAELGLRKVDTDDLIFGDGTTVHSSR